MTDSATASERRTAPRYGCAGVAEIVLPGRGLRFTGKIGNLSVGGCFIEARCDLERGTAVEVWMQAEGQPLRVAANLMVRRTCGVGLRFLGMTERKTLQVRALIAELAEEERRLHPDASPIAAAVPPAEVHPQAFTRHRDESRSVLRVNWLVSLARRLRLRKSPR